MRSDDELERMLRIADPVKDLANPDDYRWMRDEITRESVTRPRRHAPRPWSLGVVPLSAIAALLAFVFIVFTPTQHAAIARTPRPLDFHHTDQTTSEVLVMAQSALQNRGDNNRTALRHTVAQGWYLHFDHDAAQEATGVISPEITTYDWSDDQSGRVTIVAGEPYRIDGSASPLPDDVRKPGTVLSDMSFSAGSFGAPTVEPPPDDEGGMQAWLGAMGLPEQPTAADFMTTIQRAMTYWTLTDRQHSAILQLLLHQPNVRLLGTTNDRAGRQVVGVAADSTSAPGNRTITLISATTGRIVGMETVRTTPLDGLPVGAVTSYTIWENTK